MNTPPGQEILTVKLTRREQALLEALGRKIGLPVDLQILEAIRRYVEVSKGA